MIERAKNGFIKTRNAEWINPDEIVKYNVDRFGTFWYLNALARNGFSYRLAETQSLPDFLQLLEGEGFKPTLPECAFCHEPGIFYGRTCTTCSKSTINTCQCTMTQIKVSRYQINHYCPDCGVPEGMFIWEAPLEEQLEAGDTRVLTRRERIREFAAYTLTRPILPAIFGRG